MRRTLCLGALAALTTLTACSSHPRAHATPTVTKTVTAESTPAPNTLRWATPSPRPDYCAMKNPPKDYAATVIHDTHVIDVEAVDPNPDGGVTILAREECHIAPGDGDDGQYEPTGPVRTYLIAPTAQIYLVDGINSVQVPMSDFITRIHQYHPRLQGDWIDHSQNFKIAIDGSGNITRFEQLWHP